MTKTPEGPQGVSISGAMPRGDVEALVKAKADGTAQWGVTAHPKGADIVSIKSRQAPSLEAAPIDEVMSSLDSLHVKLDRLLDLLGENDGDRA